MSSSTNPVQVRHPVIVVGGGLSGLSATHMILHHGGHVLLLDKKPLLGGNSSRATSGINAALTQTQVRAGIPDSPDIFYEDTLKGARDRVQPELVRVLTGQSAPAVEWLQNHFGLDLSLVSRLGGHSQPRTHRGKERFPGMTITYGLMEALEQIAAEQPQRAQVLTKARVVRLLTEPLPSLRVVGVEFDLAGQRHSVFGPVVIATGGYAADFGADSLLHQHRPDLIKLDLSTTNGDHTTGDGIKLALAAGAGAVDLDMVQVHPTGLIDPKDPTNKVKFLAAEALRGVGGIMLDIHGRRFCNELAQRDIVTGEMRKAAGPIRLVLNAAAAKEIEWHCHHYAGKGLMRRFSSGEELAAEMKVSPDVLRETFAAYNDVAAKKSDPLGRLYFTNLPYRMDDSFFVALIEPVLHYTMGGLRIRDDANVLTPDKTPVQGLFACGEVAGGVHGVNRLGGSSLLDCVVFGRVAGVSAARYHLAQLLAATGQSAANSGNVAVKVFPEEKRVQVDFTWDASTACSQPQTAACPFAKAAAAPNQPSTAAPAAPAAPNQSKVWTVEEVAKHNKKDDVWVIVNGQVLDVTGFLSDHPGGAQAILAYAGRDATEQFNMLHKPDVVEKYAPQCIIGVIQGSSGASAPAPAPSAASSKTKVWTVEEVAKHNKKDDVWVIVNGQVLDVTGFLSDHPGGAQAILAYAGRDATEQFNMLHKPDVVEKYAPQCIIGVIQGNAKL